ncbi:Nup85p [Sugiyamaella lignohabitans]|uniref:Nuclear pore complex protein Nup85 n=1 Tax=Sugiyamaella lignohabitans TaxID=796027 RepID=A0A167C1T0_9ASCO|nr:Nup85p [Sugiyamaella lignohabitans]ANB11112.1 Nup85p [Sugiyamaella lignohabitans]
MDYNRLFQNKDRDAGDQESSSEPKPFSFNLGGDSTTGNALQNKPSGVGFNGLFSKQPENSYIDAQPLETNKLPDIGMVEHSIFGASATGAPPSFGAQSTETKSLFSNSSSSGSSQPPLFGGFGRSNNDQVSREQSSVVTNSSTQGNSIFGISTNNNNSSSSQTPSLFNKNTGPTFTSTSLFGSGSHEASVGSSGFNIQKPLSFSATSSATSESTQAPKSEKTEDLSSTLAGKNEGFKFGSGEKSGNSWSFSSTKANETTAGQKNDSRIGTGNTNIFNSISTGTNDSIFGQNSTAITNTGSVALPAFNLKGSASQSASDNISSQTARPSLFASSNSNEESRFGATDSGAPLAVPSIGLDLLSQVTSLDTNYPGRDTIESIDSGFLDYEPNMDSNNLETSQPSVSEFSTAPEFTLEDAPIQNGGLEHWHNMNRTLKFTISTVGNGGVAWIDRRNRDKQSIQNEPTGDIIQEEKKLFSANIPSQIPNSPGYIQFVKDCYNIVKECQDEIESDSSGPVNVVCKHYFNLLYNRILESLNYVEDDTQMMDVSFIVYCFLVVYFEANVKSESEPFAKAFSKWANTVDEGSSPEDAAEIMRMSPPTKHPLYWDFVHDRASRGLLEVCASTLQEANSKEMAADVRESIHYATQLLRSYPNEEGSEYKFHQWKRQCNIAHGHAQDIADPALRIQLVRLFDILRGHKATILEQNSNSWFVALSALVMFNDPSRSRLKEYFDIVQAEIPIDSLLKWESGCAAVISGDILVAIQKLESLDSCVATAVAQLCQMRGLLDDYGIVRINNEPSVRDWLVLSHGQNCITSEIPELEKIGINILVDLDIPQSRATLAEYLPRYVAHDVEELEWVLSTANELGLHDTERQIHRIAARNYAFNGCFLEAFFELDKAKDASALQALSWQLFEDSLVFNEPAAEDLTIQAVLPNSGVELSPLVHEIMAPFAVLNEAFELLRSEKYIQAGGRILALLRFPYLPGRFVAPLLSMIISLLSHNKQPRSFTSTDLVLVMDTLDMWEKQATNTKDHVDTSGYKEGLAIIERAVHTAKTEETLPLKNNDWRALLLSIPVEKIPDFIISTGRIVLAREVSRAYLSGL